MSGPLQIIPGEDDDPYFFVKDGPVWKDECNHGPDCYVASFEILNRHGKVDLKEATMDRYDLYIFEHSLWGHEVCIRYGNEPQEYISPGRLIEFLQHGKHEPYTTAIRILTENGFVQWQLRRKPEPIPPEPPRLTLPAIPQLSDDPSLRKVKKATPDSSGEGDRMDN